MASVTSRINAVKQPRGGYIKPSEFDSIVFDDGITLNATENVHGVLVGMTVDYLTRFAMGTNVLEAFKISLKGADVAEEFGVEKSKSVAFELINGITGLDEKSVINACKLVSFDAWLRNPSGAMMAKRFSEINPDKETVENIQTLVKRGIKFFEKYGPIIKDGFSFEPIESNDKAYGKRFRFGEGSYGGYTATVDSGDGDFLTSDTLWDFKVSKSKPTNKHTLQLLMYWIMGLHSGQTIFRSIKKLGLFNPRLNTVYLLDVTNISANTIKAVEDEVICY